jgi:hypothetical protein
MTGAPILFYPAGRRSMCPWQEQLVASLLRESGPRRCEEAIEISSLMREGGYTKAGPTWAHAATDPGRP